MSTIDVAADRRSVTSSTVNFSGFVRANTSTLMGSAYMLTGSRWAAEELVQDTFTRLYPRWTRVQAADVPLAYVRRTLTNQFITSQRRARREIAWDDVADRPAAGSVEGDTVDREDMKALLQTVTWRQRAVLVLRYYQGLSDTEIAEILGCRTSTVRSLSSRALTALRLHPHLSVRPTS